jgi:hypothetical protein
MVAVAERPDLVARSPTAVVSAVWFIIAHGVVAISTVPGNAPGQKNRHQPER